MPTFGERSTTNLAECRPELQKVAFEAIKLVDFAVICGFRNKADQNKAKAEGRSKAAWGQSPHNFAPSFAFDIAPWHRTKPNIRWEGPGAIEAFEEMGRIVMQCADNVGVQLTWGRDFSFVDYPHFELTHWRDLK